MAGLLGHHKRKLRISTEPDEAEQEMSQLVEQATGVDSPKTSAIRRIKCAAIINDDGQIYEGPSHCEIGFRMVRTGACQQPYPGGKSQGFVDTDGNFVSRKEAYKIAVKAGQIVGNPNDGNELFSETFRSAQKLDIKQMLDCLSADERADIFHEYCTRCGSRDVYCQCSQGIA